MNNLFGHPNAVVYLIKYSDQPIYKIGYTSDLNTRFRDIGIALPYRIKLIHSIYTDSPKWLENYWHTRFASQRRPGSGIRRPSEWFDLTDSDVRDFMSYKDFDKPKNEKLTQLVLTEQNEEAPREAAIRRVIKHFNDLIRQHPHHAVKLANSCNFQISQLNKELLRMQNNHIPEQDAIAHWEQRAYRAADKKVQSVN